MSTPRKHAGIIKAWADGKEVEWFDPIMNTWNLCVHPQFSDTCEYRVKPERIFPKSSITIKQLDLMFKEFGSPIYPGMSVGDIKVLVREQMLEVADLAIKQYILEEEISGASPQISNPLSTSDSSIRTFARLSGGLQSNKDASWDFTDYGLLKFARTLKSGI